MIKAELIRRLNAVCDKQTDEEITSELRDIILDVSLSMFSIDQLPAFRPEICANSDDCDNDPREKRIIDLHPSVRLINILYESMFDRETWKFRIDGVEKREDIKLKHIIMIGARNIEKVRNCGRKTMRELTSIMEQQGLYLPY